MQKIYLRVEDLIIDCEDTTLMITAIHRGDDLSNLLWDIVKVHIYIPAVSFDMGNITSIGLSFNGNRIMGFMRQHKLIKHTIEGAVEVDTKKLIMN